MNKITITLFTFFLFLNLNLYSQTTLTHNIGNSVVQNSMYSCSWGGICWARKFVLSDYGIKSNQNFIINSGEVGLFYSVNWDTNLQFNIYAVDSNFPSSFSESNLIGSSQVVRIPMSDNKTQIITINFDNPVIVPSSTEEILVEVFQLHSTNSEAHAFVAGTADDNDFSWFRSKSGGCPPYNEYKTTLSLNRPDAKFYITVNGEAIDDTPFNITVNKDCNGLQKQFSLVNSLDIKSIVWNFGDINSNTENTSTLLNPIHTFSSASQYEVTATFTNILGQIYNRRKLISVKSSPVANKVKTLYACEDTNSSATALFNTSKIQSELLGNQTGMIVSYFHTNGNPFQSPLPNPLQSKTETITARVAQADNLNCYSETIFNLIVNPLKLPIASSLQSFCNPINIDLDDILITGQNIKWYDALTAGNLLLNTTSLQNGATYYASQTINGCEGERIPILINIQNTLAPTGDANQTFCISQNPTLNNISISGTNPKWYDNLGTLLPDSTPLLNNETYYATQTVNNCESITKLTVTISLINSLPANNYEELICDDLNDNIEKVNLTTYNSNLISNVSVYNFTYYKSLSDAEDDLKSNQIFAVSNYILSLGENKIYVRINSNGPCFAIAELKLTLVSKPFINISDIVPICENKTITIDAGAGYDSYLWSNGATSHSIVVANPANFSVTVTKNYSTITCSSTKSFVVKTSNVATITSIETKDWTDNENIITVYVKGNGDYEYSINGSGFQNSNQFSGLKNGKYIVSVKDKNGCGTSTEEVYLLMYPKFFTPNGDGYNDTWKINFSDQEALLTIKIFDRYGKFITELKNNTGWNGTFNGHELPATDYWFVVDRGNGKEYRGHFTLKR